MTEARPLNVPLILFTVAILILSKVSDALTEPVYYSSQKAFVVGLLVLLFAPIGFAWTRALWNTLVPRITGWREITFMEAAGVCALPLLLIW